MVQRDRALAAPAHEGAIERLLRRVRQAVAAGDEGQRGAVVRNLRPGRGQP